MDESSPKSQEQQSGPSEHGKSERASSSSSCNNYRQRGRIPIKQRIFDDHYPPTEIVNLRSGDQDSGRELPSRNKGKWDLLTVFKNPSEGAPSDNIAINAAEKRRARLAAIKQAEHIVYRRFSRPEETLDNMHVLDAFHKEDPEEQQYILGIKSLLQVQKHQQINIDHTVQK